MSMSVLGGSGSLWPKGAQREKVRERDTHTKDGNEVSRVAALCVPSPAALFLTLFLLRDPRVPWSACTQGTTSGAR